MSGVVAAGSKGAAEAGRIILNQGGNAVDAAVAATFASFVCEISVVNIGGGGYAVLADGKKHLAYDFFASMPSGETSPEMDFKEILIDFGTATQAFHIGRASSAVPGVVAGLCRMLRDHGRLPLPQVLAPAIALARHGFDTTHIFTKILHMLGDIFGNDLKLRDMVHIDARHPLLGEKLQFEELANTLEILGEQGPDYFYRGQLAEHIVADHEKNRGLILAKDLANYEVQKSQALEVSYRDCTVLLPPPSSMGGTLIAFALKLLETVPLSSMVFGSLEHVHALTHVMALSNKAREDWDQERESKRKPEQLLAPEKLAPYVSQLKERLSHMTPVAADPHFPEGAGNTSHISTLDSDGLAVSITTTAGENSGYLIGDTGVCLNNMLGESDLNPYGFHKRPAGARIMSMMSPAIVCREVRPILCVGSAGSNRLRSAILQSISNFLDFGMDPQASVNAPRIHFESGILHMEPGYANDATLGMKATGFQVKSWDEQNLYFGGAQAVARHDQTPIGGADQRREGAVAHFP